MDELPERVRSQIEVIRSELRDLEEGPWHQKASIHGSRPLRSVADRIVLSARQLKSLVSEDTFSR